jgi:hypothetical protein
MINYCYIQGCLDTRFEYGKITRDEYNDLTLDNWTKMKGIKFDYGEDYLKSLRRGDDDGQAGKSKEDVRHQSAG